VLVYEPPERVVISWDIDPQWQLETDVDKTSEVEVRFIAEGPDRTRVELEHRNLDRHGDGWEAVREGVGSEGGWPLYLRRFAEACQARCARDRSSAAATLDASNEGSAADRGVRQKVRQKTNRGRSGP